MPAPILEKNRVQALLFGAPFGLIFQETLFRTKVRWHAQPKYLEPFRSLSRSRSEPLRSLYLEAFFPDPSKTAPWPLKGNNGPPDPTETPTSPELSGRFDPLLDRLKGESSHGEGSCHFRDPIPILRKPKYHKAAQDPPARHSRRHRIAFWARKAANSSCSRSSNCACLNIGETPQTKKVVAFPLVSLQNHPKRRTFKKSRCTVEAYWLPP